MVTVCNMDFCTGFIEICGDDDDDDDDVGFVFFPSVVRRYFLHVLCPTCQFILLLSTLTVPCQCLYGLESPNSNKFHF